MASSIGLPDLLSAFQAQAATQASRSMRLRSRSKIQTMKRAKRIKCPHCDTLQVVYVLAPPDKPVELIGSQTVTCVNEKCNHNFQVTNTEEIVDGPFEV